jgi:hypothetical protein
MRKLILGLIGFALMMPCGGLRAHDTTESDSHKGVLLLAQAGKSMGGEAGNDTNDGRLSYNVRRQRL